MVLRVYSLIITIIRVFFALDFSLHGEKGKKGDYGLSKKQTKNRFSKKRDDKSAGKQRENEYFNKKN
jgi:hypothetical protein